MTLWTNRSSVLRSHQGLAPAAELPGETGKTRAGQSFQRFPALVGPLELLDGTDEGFMQKRVPALSIG